MKERRRLKKNVEEILLAKENEDKLVVLAKMFNIMSASLRHKIKRESQGITSWAYMEKIKLVFKIPSKQEIVELTTEPKPIDRHGNKKSERTSK